MHGTGPGEDDDRPFGGTFPDFWGSATVDPVPPQRLCHLYYTGSGGYRGLLLEIITCLVAVASLQKTSNSCQRIAFGEGSVRGCTLFRLVCDAIQRTAPLW